MNKETTLAQALWAGNSLLRNAVLVLSGSALIAVSAQISVPMYPVPMSLQTLAVIFVGLMMGSRLGAASVIAYLAEGAAGLPVFSNGGFGVAYLMGPTGGYLIGFVAMAWAAGALAESRLGRNLLALVPGLIAISAFVYLPGVLWLSYITGMDVSRAAQVGALPFLPGDLLKSLIAALVMTGAWAALARKG